MVGAVGAIVTEPPLPVGRLTARESHDNVLQKLEARVEEATNPLRAGHASKWLLRAKLALI